jgi:hypothetical protein
MQRPGSWTLATVVAVLALGLGACGETKAPTESASARVDRAVKECRAQWGEVGETVLGMDEDTNPSALSSRWNSVIATVEYYKTTDSADNCQANIETQLRAVSALRQFSEKLRPYDMTYQLAQVGAAVDLYLHDPLPAAVRGQNGNLVKPPTTEAVSQAMKVLTDNAVQANAELEPGWAQTSSVDLDDVTTLTTTMHDLDFLAQDSPPWRLCEEALQVLVAAIRAQEGLDAPAASPSDGPTDATTPAG